MSNIVITSSANRLYVAFNDLSSQAGITSGDWDKSAAGTQMNIGDIDLFFIVLNLQQWRFSYNGSAGSLQVDSVDGVSPTNNIHLKSLLDVALVITGGSVEWGDITGLLGDQTDLQAVLDGKQPAGSYATGGGTASGTNTGDNATNSQYSGLASSKQNTLVSGTNIKTINGQTILGSGDLVVSSGYHFVGTLAGDQATGANVTPVTLTGLVFSYVANSKYRIWFMGNVQPTAATTGCGFQFDLSSAVTSISVQFFHQLANTGTISGGHSIADDASVGVSSGMPGTSTYPISGQGMLITTANAGTAQLRFRSETTAVTTCKSGFTLVVEKIA